jgi:hypothetical protein
MSEAHENAGKPSDGQLSLCRLDKRKFGVCEVLIRTTSCVR